jgi:uncharacterized membrane protein
VDAARGVALAGMASVHILPVVARDGTETVAGAVAAGRASALFAVLAGVGIALSTGGRVRPQRPAPMPPRPPGCSCGAHWWRSSGWHWWSCSRRRR